MKSVTNKILVAILVLTVPLLAQPVAFENISTRNARPQLDNPIEVSDPIFPFPPKVIRVIPDLDNAPSHTLTRETVGPRTFVAPDASPEQLEIQGNTGLNQRALVHRQA